MTTMKAFIRSHPVLTYFALVFAISWGGVLVLAGPAGLPGTPESTARLLPVAIVAIVAGPSVSGILLTGLIHGRAGLRELRSRLFTWRVGARWHAVAPLAAPVLVTVLLLALSLTSSVFLPAIVTSGDRASLVLLGIFIALMAGIFEEVGWTGFATPQLRRRHGVLGTGLVVGLLWAVWHLLFAFWLSGTVSGPLALESYMLDPFLFLVPFRVLMVRVYDRTGSLLVAVLMHTSLTASARILSPPGIAGAPLLTFDFVWTIGLWGIVAVLVAGGHLSRQPVPGRVA